MLRIGCAAPQTLRQTPGLFQVCIIRSLARTTPLRHLALYSTGAAVGRYALGKTSVVRMAESQTLPAVADCVHIDGAHLPRSLLGGRLQ